MMTIDILSSALDFILVAMKKFVELINSWHTHTYSFIINILNTLSCTYSVACSSCEEVFYHLIRWRIKSRCMRVTLLHSTILFSMLSSRRTMDSTIRRWRIHEIASLGRIFPIILFSSHESIKKQFRTITISSP